MCDVIGGKDDVPLYLFETTFKPFAQLSRNQIDKIDLVVAYHRKHVRPLEVKLTVVPDLATVGKNREFWAPEIVIRPVSSAYAMFGVATSLMQMSDQKVKVMDALRPAYNRMSSSGWDNASEVVSNAQSLIEALSAALSIAENLQSPFLVQPIWKTAGQTLNLSEKCFDVFVWSDISIMRLPMLVLGTGKTISKESRYLREVARHVRSLYDVLTTDDCDYKGIYKGMSLGIQTSKSFAINGRRTIKYLRHERLLSPSVSQCALTEIVLNGGQHELKPERRFDAAVQTHMR